MSSFELHTVQTRAEFDAALDCQWATWADPFDEFWDCWFPTDVGAHYGPPRPRPEAVAESKDRLWREHVSNPGSTWIYIVDGARRRDDPDADLYVLASCQWRVYPAPANPFAAGMPDFQCPAWPAGSQGARFATKFARALFFPRVAWMSRPHVGLSWMAVRPDARRRGLGSILMRWGIERADSLELESFIEATSLGNLLYQSSGFRHLRSFRFDMTVPEQDDEWDALTRRYCAHGYPCHALWRPVKGKWEGDEMDRIWRERFDSWDVAKRPDGEPVIALE